VCAPQRSSQVLDRWLCHTNPTDCPLNILAATTTKERKKKKCFTALLHARTYGNYFPQYALKLYLQEKEMLYNEMFLLEIIYHTMFKIIIHLIKETSEQTILLVF